MELKKIAEEIFLAAIRNVVPSSLLPSIMSVNDNILKIKDLTFNLSKTHNIYVIGAGKASAFMAAEVEKIVGNFIADGHVIVKYGHACHLNHIRITEAGHPVPDSNGFNATRDILHIVKKADKNDLIICLLSGGGSALLADYPEVSSPGEMMKLNNLLVSCGASISEINIVRKHLSLVKGGQLAVAAAPATVVSLILSDVPGDPVDVIASGPTTPDPTYFRQALDVIERYDLSDVLPPGIKTYLEEGNNSLRPETPKPGDHVFKQVFNILIGTNKTALEAAKVRASEFNFNSLILDNELQGDVSAVSDYIISTAKSIQGDQKVQKPACLLFGGETTVKMTGKGMGGRNQHLALLVSLRLKDFSGITFLAGGTDGNDGNTPVAGAVVDSDTVNQAISANIFPEEYIRNFDSYHFFKKAGGLITTGPTMTNVMDILIVLIE